MRLLLLIPIILGIVIMAAIYARIYWVRVKEAIRYREYGWLAIRGVTFVVLLVAGVSLYHFGTRWWFGVAVPGDELVALVGKLETDPQVVNALRQLGYSRLEKTSGAYVTLDWDQHGISCWFDAGKVVRVSIGDSQGRFFGRTGNPTPYAGIYPFGLHAYDGSEDVRELLGLPDDWEKKKNQEPRFWVYSQRNAHINFVNRKLYEVSVFSAQAAAP